MKFFSIDSPLYRFMQRLWDIFRLNLLWLLCCLPVVTIGCSTLAAFTVTMHMADDTEGDIPKDFFKAFKANFKQGIVMTFLTLIPIYAVYLDFHIYSQIEGGSLPVLIMGIFSAYFVSFALIYAYPLLARYDNTIANSLKNSFRIGMKYFFRTVLVIAIVALELFIILWNTTTLLVGALIGPACVFYTISGTARYIFGEIEKQPGSVSNRDE